MRKIILMMDLIQEMVDFTMMMNTDRTKEPLIILLIGVDEIVQ